jgi:hypothetical protein
MIIITGDITDLLITADIGGHTHTTTILVMDGEDIILDTAMDILTAFTRIALTELVLIAKLQ